jgi:hypothetical protein
MMKAPAHWRFPAALVVLLLLSSLASPAPGQNVLRDVGEREDKAVEASWLVLPYAFSTESLDLSVGVGIGGSGYFQDQLDLMATGFGTANSSWAGFVAFNDLELPFSGRTFIDGKGMVGHYTDQRVYGDLIFDSPDDRAGSNNSGADDFATGKGWDNWFDVTFRYVLPTGAAREKAVNTFWLDRGILARGATGGKRWNPLHSGRTFLEARAFFRWRSLEDEGGEVQGDTNGLEVTLTYDNTDFDVNPSRGSVLSAGVTRDFGLFASSHPWTVVEGKFGKYFSLGAGRFTRQRVLALNAWTAFSPTWEVAESDDGFTVENRPPSYLGASLGSFDRLRGYPLYRFSDKAAVYYGAELRLTPDWNPIGDWKLLRFFEIDWWQFAPFVEVGRVAPEWEFGELHSDMKCDVGLGVRLMVMKSVVRIDTAVSNETVGVWAMVGLPF